MKLRNLYRNLSPVIAGLLLLASLFLASRLFPWPSQLTGLLQPGRLAQIIQPSPTPPPPNTDEVAAAIARIRAQRGLPELKENVTLQKLARLLGLEIEDSGVLDQPAGAPELLRSLTPNPPRRLETLLWFVPAGTSIDIFTQLSSASAAVDPQLRSFGSATRSALLDGQKGTLLVVSLSTSFSSTVAPSAPRAGASRATFTGQDLWAAVQDYRQAHQLPLFALSTELCTVASIRVNQLLELGKLDNHAGFQPLADQFFKDHADWSAINENIAAGYQTAVQTVEWGWDQSLGHQALIQSREFPKACYSTLVEGLTLSR